MGGWAVWTAWLAPYHSWIALGVTAAVFLGMQWRRGAPADLLLLAGLGAVTAAGVIAPEDAFAGFANPAVLTIGALLVVAAGLRAAGVLDWAGERLLGGARTPRAALWRLGLTLTPAAAFIFNTAVVAMVAPVVVDWCRRRRISPSRLLMPVSYFTILGGVCTLIGTSTTLVANGMFRAGHLAGDPAPMSLFEIGRVGLPCAAAGLAFFLLAGHRLLPDRTDMLERLGEQRREYLVEMLVQAHCPLIGKSVEQAGLRHLPGLFLIEIDREGDVITPVAPQDVIHAGDRLIFTGVVSTIVDLEKIPGLVPAADTTYELHPKHRRQRRLAEAVLSRTSPLIGVTVRQANFRRRYNAAVVAVHRNGARLTNKIGDIRLAPGDTLLLQTRHDFVATYRNSRDFYLISDVEGSEPRRHDKARLAALWVVLLIGVLAWTSGGSDPNVAALAAVGAATAMVLSGCLRMAEARSALDLQVLISIAAALGLGRAVAESGAAAELADFMLQGLGTHPYVLLAVLYATAVVLTEMISNVAVAATLLPVAAAVAVASGYHPRPFLMGVTLAASLSFVSPIGYQTNLMVMGPGGYRPWDYVRCGLPLALVVGATALALIPIAWPF